ncbi:MAG: nucleotidyltransferase domain-containing protein [Candidatus Kapaibacterium sp.]
MYVKDYLDYSTNFVKSIAKKDIGLRYAKLFGSYAKGNQNCDSDIDILLVADKFVGAGFIDNWLIANELVKFDVIQVKTYSYEDYIEGDPFIEEINKYAVNIEFN